MNQPSASCEKLLYPNLSTVSEQLIGLAATPLISNAEASNEQLIHDVAAKRISNAATVNEQFIKEMVQANNK